MAQQPPASSSLARSTLIHMGVRIACIIALTTFFSYLQIFNSARDTALAQLQRSVSERAQREQAIFVLAKDNHAFLQERLKERVRLWRQQDPRAAFERLFASLPDGTVRSRLEGFDGTRMPCLFIPAGRTLAPELQRWLLASYEVLTQYAPAFHVRFTDTYISLPGGAVMLYWPDRPNWCHEATPDFDVTQFEFYTLSTPEQDPERQTVWSGIIADTVAKTWTVSASTPVDMDGRHFATLTHDILIQELMARTINDHLPDAYNMLFRDDGQLIAHPELNMEGAETSYNLRSGLHQTAAPFRTANSSALRQHLFAIFQQLRNTPAPHTTRIPASGEYAATARFNGPGWTFVTLLPESVVSRTALGSAQYVLVFGVASLLLELGIMSWVLRQKISQPLLSFSSAADSLAAGDFNVGLDLTRRDELGRLAQAFQRMAIELQRREDALRQANEGLEQRVEHRTRELQDVHRQLIETARQVGRAEVATNVLHNVGNVLNSVHTSALIARERLSGLKLESVEKVVVLLQEHQTHLASFLTEDERGRNALPFLSRLGRHMQEEREEINALLHDVSRYTEHIGAIVKLQQRYARAPQHLFEPVNLAELVEDALRINQAALGRHSVRVRRDLEALPPLVTEKHKVLMILVNLISNAKYALESIPEEQRLIIIGLRRTPEARVLLTVRDNGIGIAPEMLTRIFQHGFTTREEGHGFGLHSSALAAQEMGGSLTASSEGPGQGATFTLDLPVPSDPLPPPSPE
ncbi:sensor histidine kinase [Archangium primigenium]|uniref:sensor histidine kinase n=1 Tax=[Archangium] primigenium TaxID=2792470 RepID=UPI001EF98FE8|nr:ATP-binding protein [Archangium primigenium]